MFIICSSLLIKYSTFTVFVSSVKALIVLVSSSIINISYAGFRKISEIIIVNVSGPKIDPWRTPLFIGKVYQCTSSNLTDCLQLVECFCCELHCNGSWLSHWSVCVKQQSTCLSHMQLHKYSISVVNKHSGGTVSYSIGNMNNNDYK